MSEPITGEVLTLSVAKPSRLMTVIRAAVVVTLSLAMIIAAFALSEVAEDRDGWRAVADRLEVQNAELREQVAAQREELACRSATAIDYDEAAGTLLATLGEGIAASAREQSIEEFINDLEADAQEIKRTLAERRKALNECTPPTTEETGP